MTAALKRNTQVRESCRRYFHHASQKHKLQLKQNTRLYILSVKSGVYFAKY